MVQHVTAIYDDGVLRPLGPLRLNDQEVVSIVVQTSQEEPSLNGGGEGSTLYDVLQGDGLIGCVQDAPPDLSENLRHLEGFGKRGA